MLCRSQVTRWSSMCHVVGDACSNAWYFVVLFKAPLLPAKPGPTLKGTRATATLELSARFKDSLLLLLLLPLLLLPLLLLLLLLLGAILGPVGAILGPF